MQRRSFLKGAAAVAAGTSFFNIGGLAFGQSRPSRSRPDARSVSPSSGVADASGACS